MRRSRWPRAGRCCRRRRRDRRPQEQLRRQGQQLRLPRELPARPRDAVRAHRRPDHAALRHPPGLQRRRQGRLRAARASPHDDVPFQLSQRADFFEEEVGLETTLKRPIVNTRDEPHCDAQKYRRLHVIVGDANMSEVATYLKVGTTAIVLAMIEDDALGDDWSLGQPGAGDPPGQPRPDAARARHAARRAPGHGARGPVGAARAGPASTSSSHGLACVGEDGRRRRARAVGARAHRPRARPERRSPTGSTGWPSSASSTAIAERHDLQPGDARLKAIDLQYHDLRPDRCLALAGRPARRSSTRPTSTRR